MCVHECMTMSFDSVVSGAIHMLMLCAELGITCVSLEGKPAQRDFLNMMRHPHESFPLALPCPGSDWSAGLESRLRTDDCRLVTRLSGMGIPRCGM